MSSEPVDNQERGDDAEPSFEQAMDRLEAILDRVESGEAGLEQSIAECEKGAKLIARCRTILDASEKRIGELNLEALSRAEPAAAEHPFDETDDETDDEAGSGDDAGDGGDADADADFDTSGTEDADRGAGA